jgi:thiol-disulfide isomerase/thioredoxin
MTRRRSAIVMALVAMLAAAAGLVVSRQHHPQEGPAPGAELFYQQSLRDAAGTTHAMSEHRGKVVVVNFWATWCVPCVKEIPAFSKVHAAAAGRVAFVGLGIDSPDNIKAFTDRFHPSYPLLAAGVSGSDVARAFGDDAGALPFTVVLDGAGRVVAQHLGQVDEETLERWLAPYLGGGKSATAVGATPPA